MPRKPRPKIKAPFNLGRLRGKRVVITFHSLGDLDAAGSAIALARFVGKNAIVAPPDRPTAAARRLLEYSGTATMPFSDAKQSPRDFLVVLDSSSSHLLAHLAGIEPDLMVDHHSRLGGELPARFLINDPSASSTCEMLAFLLNPKDAVSCIALLAGIISDSASFRHASSRTFEAASALLSRSGLSYPEILRLASSPESFTERLEAVRSCKTVYADRAGEHIVAAAMAKSHEAHFADMLIHIGADIAFVGCEGQDGRISARMRSELRGRVRLDSIMFEAGKVMGGSGSGHELAAAASGNAGSVKAALGICLKLAEQQLLSSEYGKVKKIEW